MTILCCYLMARIRRDERGTIAEVMTWAIVAVGLIVGLGLLVNQLNSDIIDNIRDQIGL